MVESAAIESLIKEFAQSYVPTKGGQKHLAAYASQRDAGRRNYEEVTQAAARGDDVTDRVLLKLLPHANTKHNRSSGAWICIAPVITKDVKTWFENVGWTKSSDWPLLASAILLMLRRVSDRPSELDDACREFAELPYTKGMQSAFFSPILNALRPDDFRIVNTKSLKALWRLCAERHSGKFRVYPVSNIAVRTFFDRFIETLRPIAGPNVRPDDVCDAFFHWLIAVKRFGKPGMIAGEARPKIPTTLGAPDRNDPAWTAAWVEAAVPDPPARRSCLEIIADAIVQANASGVACWEVTERRTSIRLNVGRFLTVKLFPGHVRLGVSDAAFPAELLKRFEAEGRLKSTFHVEDLRLLDLKVDAVPSLRVDISPAFHAFVAKAAASAKRSPHARSHSPGFLDYLRAELNRPLPDPQYDSEGEPEKEEKSAALPPAKALNAPLALFKKVDYELSVLLGYLDLGDIALPDIQRPFVWTAAKVRDLFDSMFRGFPVGSLLFWASNQANGTKTIGVDPTQHVPHLVIVDGQQRLTSLYAVIRGKRIVDDNYQPVQIEIAFRPRDGRFEVTDAAIRNDPEWIPSISEVWKSGKGAWGTVSEFFAKLETRRTLTSEDKQAMSHNLERLVNLQKYPFTALEIVPDIEEEAVANIFVRINSEGVKLNQADFILTLLSVFWSDGRVALERFAQTSRIPPALGAAPTPFNHFVQPDADQLLRVAIAVGFHRARLRSVYQILRGRNPETGELSADLRAAQFSTLKDAQTKVLDLGHWHSFLKILLGAGFRSRDLISSETTVLYAYVFYLLGKLQYGVEYHVLERLIAKWFFASSLTARFTGSSETIMEEDLASVRDVTAPDAFVAVLEQIMSGVLTNDYWNITLPADLETSAPRSPAMLAFYAAQCRLGARALFSEKKVAELLDPALKPPKAPLERHHLFPRKWLQKTGISEPKQINQAANFALLEWPENVQIGANGPATYLPEVQKRFSESTWVRMCGLHALPPGWEHLSYEEFLRARRPLMAKIIRRGYQVLSGEEELGAADEGTPDERRVWESLQRAERELRAVIRKKYDDKWGPGADSQMRKTLGEQAWQFIERTRLKAAEAYPYSQVAAVTDPVLDFCYLGQLVALMIANDAWELFKTAFQDKRQLEDLAKAITPVRNDFAHFRAVPDRELQRCELGASDIAAAVGRLSTKE